MFQWTGGGISGAAGDLTNLGTINLAGSSDKLFYNDGTLDNYGSIVQTGTGNFALHSDNQAPTVLNIEPGGSYDLRIRLRRFERLRRRDADRERRPHREDHRNRHIDDPGQRHVQ